MRITGDTMLLAQHNSRPIMRTMSCVKDHLVEPTTYCFSETLRPHWWTNHRYPSTGNMSWQGPLLGQVRWDGPGPLSPISIIPKEFRIHFWLPFCPSLMRKNPDFLQISHIHAPQGSLAPPKVIPFPHLATDLGMGLSCNCTFEINKRLADGLPRNTLLILKTQGNWVFFLPLDVLHIWILAFLQTSWDYGGLSLRMNQQMENNK